MKIPDPYKMKRVRGPILSKSELEKAKIRITTHLDKDALTRLQQLAGHSKRKYRILLNQVLSDYLFGSKEDLMTRIERLEKAVFKKKAA